MSETSNVTTEVVPKHVIKQNVALWRKKQQHRKEAENRRENSKRFNTLADRMPAWEVK